MRIRGFLIGAVVAVALAGCTPAVDDAAPTPTPTSTPSPTPTPEPVKPALGDLVLSADGLGPLQLGQAPPVTAPELDTLVFDEDYCDVKATPGLQHDEPGAWLTNYPDVTDSFYSEYATPPFAVSVHDGVVRRIDVRSASIMTAEGIHVGSTREEVMAAYPQGFTTSLEGTTTDVYVIDGTAGRLIIEVTTDDRYEGYWESDEVDQVFYLAARDLELQAGGVAGSDNSILRCYEY